MIPLNDFELESEIIKNSVDWISKSALFRKVGGNRNRLFSKIDDLVYNGTLDSARNDYKILVRQNLANSDDPTWYSVYDFIEKQLQEAIDQITSFKGNHLFKGWKKKIYNPIELQSKYKKPIEKFRYQIDTVMQHIVKLEYAKIFGLAKLSTLEKRQNYMKSLLKKSVSAVESSLKNEFDRNQFKQLMQQTDRTWNIHI